MTVERQTSDPDAEDYTAFDATGPPGAPRSATRPQPAPRMWLSASSSRAGGALRTNTH